LGGKEIARWPKSPSKSPSRRRKKVLLPFPKVGLFSLGERKVLYHLLAEKGLRKTLLGSPSSRRREKSLVLPGGERGIEYLPSIPSKEKGKTTG